MKELNQLRDNPVLQALWARRIRGCDGKERHRSKGAADAQMRSLLRRDDIVQDADRLNTYHCRHCGGWHVGRRSVQ